MSSDNVKTERSNRVEEFEDNMDEKAGVQLPVNENIIRFSVEKHNLIKQSSVVNDNVNTENSNQLDEVKQIFNNIGGWFANKWEKVNNFVTGPSLEPPENMFGSQQQIQPEIPVNHHMKKDVASYFDSSNKLERTVPQKRHSDVNNENIYRNNNRNNSYKVSNIPLIESPDKGKLNEEMNDRQKAKSLRMIEGNETFYYNMKR